MKYLFINKKTHNDNYEEALLSLEKFLSDGFNEIEVSNDDFNYEEFMKKLEEKDEVIICGGDGTLNYFINHIDLDNIKNNIYLYPAGTGNDFLNDLNKKDTKELILINEYLKNLPTVIINDELKMKFINGVGYRIDGYCCEVADNLRDKINKPVNYSSIAIKGLLFHFKKRIANIKIDGIDYQFKNVWLVPTMKGRFYGGGMMIAPNQDRLKDEDLSVVVYKTKSKLKALMVFPSIFKGEHIKKKKVVKIFKGKNIEVSFNIPCALQVDGENILNVKKYEFVL